MGGERFHERSFAASVQFWQRVPDLGRNRPTLGKVARIVCGVCWRQMCHSSAPGRGSPETGAVKKVLGRFAALVVVVAAALVAAPAQSLAGEELTGSVTIQGDTETPPDYAVLFVSTESGSGSGEGFHTSTFSADVSHLPAGDWIVRFDLKMMDNAMRYYVAGDPDGSPDKADATVLTLGGGDPLPAIDLVLQPMATLTGRVTDAAGAGVSGATVEVARLAPWGWHHSTTTDAQGFYDLGYVRSGVRRVEVVGRGDLAGAGVDVTVPETGALTADLTMATPSASLAGTVVDSVTGQPLSYASLEAWLQPYDIPSGTTRADASGHFEFTGLRTGDYFLWAQDEMSWEGFAINRQELVSVVAGETTSHDIPIEAIANPWDYTASGKVTDSHGEPLVGIKVTASGLTRLPEHTFTDRDGNWRLQLADGDYRVRVEPRRLWYDVRPGEALWAPEYYPDSYGDAGATMVTITDQQPVTGLDMALDEGTLMTLDLRDPAGVPVINAGYRLFDATSGQQVEDVLPGMLRGDPMELRLPAGNWKLLVLGISHTYGWLVPQWSGGAPSYAAAPTITLTPGEVRPTTTLTLPATLQATIEPRIIGKPKPGRTLRATKGQWNLMTGTTYEFAWTRGSTALGFDQRYVVRKVDRGKLLTAYITIDNDGIQAQRTLTIRVPRA